MMHHKRTWSVFPVPSDEWLAEQLTQFTYCCCSGFRLGKYVFVNDATCPDGGQEYGVLLRLGDRFVQIESLTFSGMTKDKALHIIRRVLAGEFDETGYDVAIDSRQLQSLEEHEQCYHCA